MNKQEIDKAIKFHEEILSQMKYGRDTYEDVCGTGDMLPEDREELYKNMDADIRMQEVTVSALQQQLTNGWIPASELPTQDIYCYVTIKYKDEPPYVKDAYYQTKYGFSWPNVIAYIPKTSWPKEPYKELSNETPSI